MSEPVVPSMLRHEIDYSEGGEDLYTLHAGNVAVNRSAPTVLGAPFHAGLWVAVHSPSWPRGHRRVFYALLAKAGRLRDVMPSTFLDGSQDGRTTLSNGDVPSQAVGYGAPSLCRCRRERCRYSRWHR